MMTKQKIKLISHRGNLNGVNPDRENSPSYIQEAITAGYDVEIDVHWWNSGIWLGHDKPDWEIPLSFLEDIKDRVWIHCKNFQAFSHLLNTDFRIFFHENERYAMINNGLIWAHDLDMINEKCIIPLLSKEQVLGWEETKVYGVCSDYVELFK